MFITVATIAVLVIALAFGISRLFMVMTAPAPESPLIGAMDDLLEGLSHESDDEWTITAPELRMMTPTNTAPAPEPIGTVDETMPAKTHPPRKRVDIQVATLRPGHYEMVTFRTNAFRIIEERIHTEGEPPLDLPDTPWVLFGHGPNGNVEITRCYSS